MTTPRRKPQAPKTGKRYYTFRVSVAFDMQFTFTESEVQAAEEGGKEDLDPTDEALAKLAEELKETLSQDYWVQNVEVFADFESLLGTSSDE
jgi:rRNA maturation endonuclease Nob1